MQVFAIVDNYLMRCRCECKDLIDKGIFHKGFIWNPSTCGSECDKSCGKKCDTHTLMRLSAMLLKI